MCSPYSLPSRHPGCGSQEGASLAIFSPPAEAGFRTLSRPLLIQAGRLTRWNGWSSMLLLVSSFLALEDSSSCDIVSQERSEAARTAAHRQTVGRGGVWGRGC